MPEKKKRTYADKVKERKTVKYPVMRQFRDEDDDLFEKESSFDDGEGGRDKRARREMKEKEKEKRQKALIGKSAKEREPNPNHSQAPRKQRDRDDDDDDVRFCIKNSHFSPLLLVLGRLQLTVLCCKSGTCDGSTTGSEAVEFVCSLMISKTGFFCTHLCRCSAYWEACKIAAARKNRENTKLHFYLFFWKEKARRENGSPLSCGGTRDNPHLFGSAIDSNHGGGS